MRNDGIDILIDVFMDAESGTVSAGLARKTLPVNFP